MYSTKIIQTKLDIIQNQISLRPKNQFFPLTLHSPEEVKQYNEHLKSLVEGEYKPGVPKSWKWKRELTIVEKNFIENERILCQNNFLYYCTRYAYIRSTLTDDTSVITLFKPNIAQRIILSMWAEAEENFFAVLELLLKARQLGLSTLVEIAIAHRIQYLSNLNALIASSDPDKTKKMAMMMKFCWDNQPPWMIGEYKPAESKELWVKFPGQNNTITAQHGTAKAGVARGDTPTIFHLTEMIEWLDPDEDIDAALLNAIHEHPAIFGIMETTGNGEVNRSAKWLKNKWKYAIKNYHKGTSRLRPVFIPYYVGTDVWPTETWVRQVASHIDINKWKPKELTKQHAQKAQEYVASMPYLRKCLGIGWKLSKIQQLWWEITRKEYEEKDKLHKFYQELASNPEESFLRGGRGVITVEQAEKLRLYARPLANYYGKPAVFAIVGEGIPREQEPLLAEIDTDRPYLTIKSEWDGKKRVYRFIPLHHDMEKWENRLFIWEFPFRDMTDVGSRPNFTYEYGLGIDGGGGVYLNNTVIEVVKKGSLKYPSEQVAEFASPNLTTSDLLPHSLAIGNYFSLNSSTIVNQAKQVIEINFGGFGLQNQLRLAGWSNFHRWQGNYAQIGKTLKRTIGWETTKRTRPLIIVHGIRAIKDGFFKINSPYFIDELLNLQKTDDSEKIEAKGEDTDDRYIAGGMVFFSLHDQELYLMDSGDETISQMFKSHYNEELDEFQPQSSLNESIEKIENNRLIRGGEGYIMQNVLPTLD